MKDTYTVERGLQFTEEELDLAAMARSYFEATFPAKTVRDYWGATRAGVDIGRWREMANLGLLGALVPESEGGLGFPDRALTLVLENAGRVALPEPFLETAWLVAPLLAKYGNAEDRDRWLPKIVSGNVRATVAVGPAFRAMAVDLCDVVLLVDRHAVRVVATEDLAWKRLAAVDEGRPWFQASGMNFDPAPPPPMKEDLTERCLTRGALGTAVALNGVSAVLLELTLEYVKTRKQFDRSIASFQSIRHRLSDAHVGVETARGAGWLGVLMGEANDHAAAGLSASVAKASASKAGKLANFEALQCHGGIGFTWEHDLHVWLRRGLSLDAEYGSSSYHHRRVAQIVLSQPEKAEGK